MFRAAIYSNIPTQQIIINHTMTQSETSGHFRLALWLLSVNMFFRLRTTHTHTIPPAERCWTNSLCDLIFTMCHSEAICLKNDTKSCLVQRIKAPAPLRHWCERFFLDVFAHADCTCTTVPPFEDTVWLICYLRRFFGFSQKVTDKSSASEKKLFSPDVVNT